MLIMLLGALRSHLEPRLVLPAQPLPATVSLERFGRLDINEATADQLETLPRIGPRLAARIVSHRETHGPFERPEDLTLVRGIGPKTLEVLRTLVRVDSAIGITRDRADARFAQGASGMAER